MPGTIWKVGEWPWLFRHPVEKGRGMCQTGYSSFVLLWARLSDLSGAEEELCDSARRQTIITGEPETELKYWHSFFFVFLSYNGVCLCTELYSHILYILLDFLGAFPPVNKWLQVSVTSTLVCMTLQTCLSLYIAHSATQEKNSLEINLRIYFLNFKLISHVKRCKNVLNKVQSWICLLIISNILVESWLHFYKTLKE